MTDTELLLKEIEYAPEQLVTEVLHFLLFTKTKFYTSDSITDAYRRHPESLPKRNDSIFGLGTNPVACDVIDAAENHDLYIYTNG
ncbi:hypothetical protein TUMEXPCC7403_10680 [Tumidithrix helvetica PCC 7403]|uniref:hypothetical protein n=1 Tax=Tumidithrix helvetica TaxID=3457545 RepID=UPI003CB6E1AC